jgi:hypothetical protein
MKQDRLHLFEQGLESCRDLLARYPDSRAVQSISKQIEYLISLEKGLVTDASRLGEITIGILTVREIESLDENAADLFHKISAEARRM